MLNITELMSTKLISIFPSESITDAYVKMCDHQIRHLLVFDESQKLIGVLSDRDILRALFYSEKKMELKVSDFMSWPILKVKEQQGLVEIINKMQESKVSAIIVENDFGIVVGIITTEDLILNFLDVIQKDQDLLDILVAKFR